MHPQCLSLFLNNYPHHYNVVRILFNLKFALLILSGRKVKKWRQGPHAIKWRNPTFKSKGELRAGNVVQLAERMPPLNPRPGFSSQHCINLHGSTHRGSQHSEDKGWEIRSPWSSLTSFTASLRPVWDAGNSVSDKVSKEKQKMSLESGDKSSLNHLPCCLSFQKLMGFFWSLRVGSPNAN